MWPMMPDLSIGTLQADAIFASALQRSDEPSAGQVRQAVAAAIRAFATPAVPNGWRRSSAIIPKRR